MINNLDHFSRPLAGEERKKRFLTVALEDLREEVKRDLVFDYVSKHFDSYGSFPGKEDIQEHYEQIYLDDYLVTEELEKCKGLFKP